MGGWSLKAHRLAVAKRTPASTRCRNWLLTIYNNCQISLDKKKLMMKIVRIIVFCLSMKRTYQYANRLLQDSSANSQVKKHQIMSHIYINGRYTTIPRIITSVFGSFTTREPCLQTFRREVLTPLKTIMYPVDYSLSLSP